MRLNHFHICTQLQRLQEGFNPSTYDDYDGGDELTSNSLARNFSAPAGTDTLTWQATQDVVKRGNKIRFSPVEYFEQ